MAGRTGARARARSLNWYPRDKSGFWWVEFDGDSSVIDCGSDASLDNTAHGRAVTVDTWVKATAMTNAAGEDVQPVIGKEYDIVTGGFWYLELYRDAEASADYIQSRIGADIPIPHSLSPINSAVYTEWMHLVMAYDDLGDRKIYFAVNGIWAPSYAVQLAAGAGLKDDADSFLYIGYFEPSYLEGGIQWLRVSVGLRWPIGVNFTPPAMCEPPAVDGSTVELWALDEGAGVVTAASVVPANQGAMTDCAWHVCVE